MTELDTKWGKRYVPVIVAAALSACSSSPDPMRAPPDAGSKPRVCYRGRVTEPYRYMVWDQPLDSSSRRWPAPEGTVAYRAFWSATIRDLLTNDTMGVVRVEWNYHWFDDEFVSRATCIEFLGVHPELAINIKPLKGYRFTEEAGGHLSVILRLRLLGPTPWPAHPEMWIGRELKFKDGRVDVIPTPPNEPLRPEWRGRWLTVVEETLVVEPE